MIALLEQAEFGGLAFADQLVLGQHLQGVDQCIGVIQIQGDAVPAFGGVAEAGQGLFLAAGFDRQKTQLGWRLEVAEDLGRTHGGAAGIGRKESLPLIGEKQRIDELGLAA